MKKAILFVFVLGFLVTTPAFGHKLITHDDSHRSLETALVIPDHKISWAIYENLDTGDTKFYTFEAKKGDSFYASIVVPKIQGLEEYSPTLILMDPRTIQSSNEANEGLLSTEKFLYEGSYPGREFYEPFGQVTYWERQEVKLTIPSDGQYYIIVVDEKNQSGKYSLAVGTIEDFSGSDFVTILPQAWFETKIFVNDYSAIGIFFFVLALLILVPIFLIIRRMRNKKGVMTIKENNPKY
ncbi:MAG: hypothetical protein GTN97_02220 [Nitrosopumilaceae archaeon]|nr:hypothetical protein [Nitrosopumilaceae archaeon]NIP09968.1 hypothetical protein [Nitrosopumilaceae archaeon]NIS94739.1 hypothetical protein [Nitrosopumilaceae archaeon]